MDDDCATFESTRDEADLAQGALEWLRDLESPVEFGGSGRGQCFFCAAIYYHDWNEPHAPDCIWKRAQASR